MTPTGKSVEEMARELAQNEVCPDAVIKCVHQTSVDGMSVFFHRHEMKQQRVQGWMSIQAGCYRCWLRNPAEIRAKYREMKGEGG
jgi:hypothetical protein